MKDEPVKVCPECRKRQVKRKIGMGAGLIFKGSGFYETDYKQAGRKKEKKSESKSESKPKGADKKKPASDSGKSATKKASS